MNTPVKVEAYQLLGTAKQQVNLQYIGTAIPVVRAFFSL